MRKRRLRRQKQNRGIGHFVAVTTARTAAALVGVNKFTPLIIFNDYESSFTKLWRMMSAEGKACLKSCPDYFTKYKKKTGVIHQI